MNKQIRRFIEEYRSGDEIFTTGGATKAQIADAENRLDVRLPEEYTEYLSECGLLMAFGFELHGIGLNGSAAFVEDTLRLREKGLEKQYIVIRNVGEYVDCLDSVTGKISTWDSTDPTHNMIYNSFDEYLLDNLVEAEELWSEDDFDDE